MARPLEPWLWWSSGLAVLATAAAGVLLLHWPLAGAAFVALAGAGLATVGFAVRRDHEGLGRGALAAAAGHGGDDDGYA